MTEPSFTTSIQADRREPDDWSRRSRGDSTRRAWLGLAVVAALAAIGLAVWMWLESRSEVPASEATPVPTAAPAASAAPVAAAPHYPIEAALAASAPKANDLEGGLVDLFGRKAVTSMFQLDAFPRRFVATVDNLGRQNAPARLWPMNPAGGRFDVVRRDDVASIAARNAERYAPYVQLVDRADVRETAALYKRHYPEFQQAYADLGYPNGYFNDRLVEVLDQLLATPEPKAPLAVHLPPIGGPLKPERPWVLYEFDDPALQSLTAGQRILVRMGPAQQRRVKARLAEFRKIVAAGRATQP